MPTARYGYLPHTADIKFVAYGKDLRELIENSALALLNVMLDVARIRRASSQTRRLPIKERADTAENLVWYVLQDILTRIDERALAAFEFRVSSLEKRKEGFEMSGFLFYKSKVENCFLTEVKAVTPYGMEVRKNAKGYEIKVVLDV